MWNDKNGIAHNKKTTHQQEWTNSTNHPKPDFEMNKISRDSEKIDQSVEYTRSTLHNINVSTERWRVSNRTGNQKPLNDTVFISFFLHFCFALSLDICRRRRCCGCYCCCCCCCWYLVYLLFLLLVELLLSSAYFVWKCIPVIRVCILCVSVW